MSGNGALENELSGNSQGVAARTPRGPSPILPPPPAALVPALTVTTPPGQDSVTRDAWKEQEAAAERRTAGVTEPPPVYESPTSSSAEPSTQAQASQPRPARPANTTQSTAATTAAAVAIAAAAQAPIPRRTRTRSSTISSPEEKGGARVDDRKWYSKKRTFFTLTASLVIILVVALVCNYVVFKNQGNGDGGWRRRHGPGSENGTDVIDNFLSDNQNEAWKGTYDVLSGQWNITQTRLDTGGDGNELDECADKANIFVPCAQGMFIKPNVPLGFFVNETSRGMFRGLFGEGIFGDDSEDMSLRPSKNGLTTNYNYESGEGKKAGCGYGKGLQILLTAKNGKDGKREAVYKITETQVISGTGCAANGGDNGDVCTCTYIGTRPAEK